MPGKPALTFRYLEPTFFAGLLDDPVLWLKVRPQGRALLFDCGQIHHLAKRLIKAVDALFISHAHMDHFMGLDTFTRNIHVSPKTIRIFGPPDLAKRLAHKLAGYDWNLTENYWCTYLVNEVHADFIKAFRLPGSKGFPRQFLEQTERTAAPIYSNRYLQVEAELADHKIPVLMFRIRERPAFLLDQAKLQQVGLARGPWLKELKKLFFTGKLRQNPLEVQKATAQSSEPYRVEDAEALYHSIRKDQAPASIGYLTDVGFTPENQRRIKDFMQGVDWLICECTFLQEHWAKARKSYHLCTSDLNQLLRDLKPRFVLPMHLSKTYLGRSEKLYEELEPPEGTTLLKVPEHLTPRPLLPEELPPLKPHR